MKLAITGRLQGGAFKGDRVKWAEMLASAPDGEYLLSLEPLTTKRRSVAQNARYWLMLTTLERHTGSNKEDLHEYFKQRFLSAGFVLRDADGMPEDAALVPKSTRRLTTEEFAHYVDKVEQLGCELLHADADDLLEG